MDNKQFFFCYDANLSYYLKYHKGFNYITKAINPNSNKIFWLYWRSEKLNQSIKEFFKVSKNGVKTPANNLVE